MKRRFLPLLLLIFTLLFAVQTAGSQPADAKSNVRSSKITTKEKDFEIPGGPPVEMLKDFHSMFPDEDFYEEPSKETKDPFVQKYPLWSLVLRRIEKDDQKRMKTEDFFDAHGEYPTAENHGDAPFSEYLLDYLQYEKKNAPPAEAAPSGLEAEIRALFPGWDGKTVTPAMEETFNQHFGGRHFGSWNPLFYGEENDPAGEDVDEGLIYEEDQNDNEFPDENWLMKETVEKPKEKTEASPKNQTAKVSHP